MISYDFKYEDKLINVGKNPVFIVGQNPGRQRDEGASPHVWQGNRSADFLMECIDGLDNLYLTNVCNYREVSRENLVEGLNDLIHKIREYQPKKIVCLGNFAYEQLKPIVPSKVGLYPAPHPSWIVRFNKDRRVYRGMLRSMITGRIMETAL